MILNILFLMIFLFIFIFICCYLIIKYTRKITILKKQLKDKDEQFHTLCQWISNLNNKYTIVKWLEKNKFKKISIYGIGYIGKLLLKELKSEGIDISYAIDKNHPQIDDEYIKYLNINELEYVDCIIVTAINDFDEIEEQIRSVINCKIVNIEDVVYELNNIKGEKI